MHTDSEWRELLSPEQFHVLRQAGTERPWSGKYVDTHTSTARTSARRAAPSCSTRAPSSSPGSGWPSFYEPKVADAVELIEDRTPRDGPHRGALPALRFAPRPRVPRRTAAHRAALLHEQPVARARARRAAHRRDRRGRRVSPARTRRSRQRRRKARWAMEVVSTTATTAAHRIGRKANARRTHLPASGGGLHPREHRPEHHDRRGHRARATGPPDRPRPAQQQPRRDERRSGGDPGVEVEQVAVEVGERGVGGAG